MKILVTRPREDAEGQAERLRALGHEPIIAPVLDIELDPSAVPPLDDAQALIVTSRNALRALQSLGLADDERELPLFAVGRATAQMAKELGFTTVHVGEGTAEQLVPLLTAQCDPGNGPLLHLAGEKIAWDLKGALEAAGFAVMQPVVYRAVAANSFPDGVAAAFRAEQIDGVILMSPESARIYVELLRAEGIAEMASGAKHFCLSAAVAAALSSLPGLAVEIAAVPTQQALLALLGPGAAN